MYVSAFQIMKLLLSVVCGSLLAPSSGSMLSPAEAIVRRVKEFTGYVKLNLLSGQGITSESLGPHDRADLIARAVSYARGDGHQNIEVKSEGYLSPKDFDDLKWEIVDRLFTYDAAKTDVNIGSEEEAVIPVSRKRVHEIIDSTSSNGKEEEEPQNAKRPTLESEEKEFPVGLGQAPWRKGATLQGKEKEFPSIHTILGDRSARFSQAPWRKKLAL